MIFLLLYKYIIMFILEIIQHQIIIYEKIINNQKNNSINKIKSKNTNLLYLNNMINFNKLNEIYIDNIKTNFINNNDFIFDLLNDIQEIHIYNLKNLSKLEINNITKLSKIIIKSSPKLKLNNIILYKLDNLKKIKILF